MASQIQFTEPFTRKPVTLVTIEMLFAAVPANTVRLPVPTPGTALFPVLKRMAQLAIQPAKSDVPQVPVIRVTPSI